MGSKAKPLQAGSGTRGGKCKPLWKNFPSGAHLGQWIFHLCCGATAVRRPCQCVHSKGSVSKREVSGGPGGACFGDVACGPFFGNHQLFMESPRLQFKCLYSTASLLIIATCCKIDLKIPIPVEAEGRGGWMAEQGINTFSLCNGFFGWFVRLNNIPISCFSSLGKGLQCEFGCLRKAICKARLVVAGWESYLCGRLAWSHWTVTSDLLHGLGHVS